MKGSLHMRPFLSIDMGEARSYLRNAEVVARRILRNLSRNKPEESRESAQTVWIASHHKAGTVWLRRHLWKALGPVGYELSRLTYDHDVYHQLGPDTGVPWSDDLDIRGRLVLDCHSVVPLPESIGLRGIHITRDPRALALSGVVYHRVTREPWARRPQKEYAGKSYQQVMLELPDSEALLQEVYHLGPTIRAMAGWNYGDSRFLNLRFEDVMGADQGFVWEQILTHLKTGVDINKAVQRFSALSPEREQERDRRRPLEQRHFSSNVAPKPTWTDEAEKLMHDLYRPEIDLLLALGVMSEGSKGSKAG